MSLAICGWKDVHTFGETLPLRNIIGYYNIDINGDKGPKCTLSPAAKHRVQVVQLGLLQKIIWII